ncbi:MAG: hypothetical protein K6G56_00125 [Clostridiales bacterium]|nr:hypothetical protein [Clostridiales bacterium]
MRYGKYLTKRLSCADIYVRIFQVLSMLASLYLIIAPGEMSILTKRGLFPYLFDLGMENLPKWLEYGVAQVYVLSKSEVAVCFILLGFALAFGLAAGALLHGKRCAAKTTRIVLAALIAADLAVRLLPLDINKAFGPAASIPAFVIRAVCLALILADLIYEAIRKKQNAAE